MAFLKSGVPDPWHIDTDPEQDADLAPDPALFVRAFHFKKPTQKKNFPQILCYFFLKVHFHHSFKTKKLLKSQTRNHSFFVCFVDGRIQEYQKHRNIALRKHSHDTYHPGSGPAILPSIHLEICHKKTHQSRILEGVEEKHVPEAAVSESRAEYGNPVLGGPVAHALLVIYLHTQSLDQPGKYVTQV